MDNQNQFHSQAQSEISEAPISSIPSSHKHKGNIWKIISLIFIGVVVVFSIVVWYGYQSEMQDQDLLNNSQNNNMDTLTVEKMVTLKVASNVGNDYFIGSSDEQNKIVDMFIKDNSMSDSTYLYFAANTAQLLNRPKDAMFLFFAAQLRKSFDYQRFDLGEPNGNNIQTYLGYLNMGAGQGINPLAIQNPELFSEAIRMIEGWNVVPSDGAYYPKENYGEPKLGKDQWESVAQTRKESFLNEFAYKQEKLLNDPKGLEAIRFLQDYNFGKLPHNSVNDQKYQEYLKVVNSIME